MDPLPTDPARLQEYRDRGGARSRKKKAAPGAAKTVALAYFARGPAHIRKFCKDLNLTYIYAGQLLRSLVDCGAIEIIGTADQAGEVGIRRDAPMYALAGTPKLRPLRSTPAARTRGELIPAARITIGRGSRWWVNS